MDDQRKKNELREFAETVAEWHKVVAYHPNQTISTCGVLGGTIYDHSEKLFKAAIAAAYPETDTDVIYDVWVNCGESIAYCVDVAKRNIQDEHERNVDLGLIPQKRCNCESMSCDTIHVMGGCPTQINQNSPTMLYLEKICSPCALRICGDGGEKYITWPK